MSEIKNDGLDQYGARPFEQQRFRATGVEGVKFAFCGQTLREACSLCALPGNAINKSLILNNRYSIKHPIGLNNVIRIPTIDYLYTRIGPYNRP